MATLRIARLEAPPPAARAELLHVLRLPTSSASTGIGEFRGNPATRTFGEMLRRARLLKAMIWGRLRATDGVSPVASSGTRELG